MKKQQRKEIENTLYQLIDAHLSHHNAKAADKIQKAIRSSSKNIAKKFSKLVKKTEAKKVTVKSKASKKTAAKK